MAQVLAALVLEHADTSPTSVLSACTSSRAGVGETEEGWGALPYYERITDLMNPFSKPLPQFFHSGCNIMVINWRFTNLFKFCPN